MGKVETSEIVKQATREYFEALASRNEDLLGKLLERSPGQSRTILVTEQLIQDYMNMVFQPFAGERRVPKYIEESSPRTLQRMKSPAEVIVEGKISFGLIGAHYRSSLSARGRRSAFAVNSRRFSSSLRPYLKGHGFMALLRGPRKSLLETLWEAVYLEQYFGLFDRKLTLGEWAFEQAKAIPIVVLSERCASAPGLEKFRAAKSFRKVVVLPDKVTENLVSKDILKAFIMSVADGIMGAIQRERESFRYMASSGGNYPEKDALRAWNKLIRSANSLARDLIAQSFIDRELTLRHAYVTGLVLFRPEERELCERLVRLFPGSTAPEIEEKNGFSAEREQIPRLLRVFQSLQFYTRRYGENCITFPYQRGQAPSKGEYRGEGSRSSVTLFWNGSDNLSVLDEIVDGARDMFSQLTSAVETRLRGRLRERPPSVNGDSAVAHVIHENSGEFLEKGDVHALLLATRDLSRALHEGAPRAFSFVLGSPEWLISDLAVVHDLMGGSFPFQIARHSGQSRFYDRTLALLRGNSAFFQDDSLALFLPYPGQPLEITHVVRIQNLGTSRRQLLSSFSRGKKAVIAVVTYGSGTGEVIHNGEVKAVLSADGQWVPAKNYHELIDRLTDLVGRLSDEETAETVVERLEPCLRRISEEPGVGGLFVIARKEAASQLRRGSISLTEVLETVEGRSLPELDTRSIYDLARDDGATIVELPSMRVWGRRLLPAGSTWSRGSEPSYDSDFNSVEQIYSLEWGTRRRTALRVSQNLGDNGLVIVISADGPMTVLQRGRIVAQFGERRLYLDNSEAELIQHWQRNPVS